MRRKILAYLCVCMAFFVFAMPVSASQSTSYTYTQSVTKDWIRTQDAYMPGNIFLNDGTLSAPEDLFLYNGKMYIADVNAETGAGRVLVYDPATGEKKILGEEYLVNPTGLFVNGEAIYIADKNGQAVYKISHTGEVLLKMGRPDSYLFSEKSLYFPTSVAVSKQGVIFVCGDGAYEGLMQFDKDGVFQGYFAANKTKLSFTERLQELIFNEEQMAQLSNRIPSPLVNADISDNDLIYSITALEASTIYKTAIQTENAVKYHNMAGEDILSKDLIQGEHNFTDIAAYKDGLSFAVTATGIIYEYDDAGNVIFSFGGLATSERSGHFTNAVAIETDEKGNLYILDKEKAYLQCFFPTEFANSTHAALNRLNSGDYLASEATWLELLSLNGMSYIAHQGYGKSLYQQQRFSEAAEQFRITGDKEYYSECMWEIRNQWFQDNLIWAVVVVVVLLVAGFVIGILKKKGILRQKRETKNKVLIRIKTIRSYMTGMMKNPFDEFYYIKRRQHGTPASATVLFLLAFAVYLFDILGRSYTFSMIDDNSVFPFSLILIFLVSSLLWVIGQFMVSAINEGEGTLGGVYTAFAYSLTPYIVLTPIAVLSTYVLTLNEAIVIDLIWWVGVLWSAALLCTAVKEIHNYNVKETIKILLLTLFFMIMAIIVCVILYLIGQQVVLFFSDIISEVSYRVGN